MDRTDSADGRFSPEGQILVTRSGTVGRATLSTKALDGILVSDDLIRVSAKDQKMWGWVYAYLRSTMVRDMMTSTRYGHVIKHLEIGHLSALPMPHPRDDVAARFQKETAEILDARNRAVDLMLKAEAVFEREVGVPDRMDLGESGYSINASLLMGGRRRLEGFSHNPAVRALHTHFAFKGLKSAPLAQLGFDLWLPTRFRRTPAEEGIELVGSSDLFEINPDITKRIVDGNFGDRSSGRVKRGWLLLARSGQIYGLNGTLAIANEFHEGKIISDHVIRIAPKDDCKVRAGYVYTALSHPTLGRPLVKALAYGSSIPEIEVADIAALPVVRLPKQVENKIADMAEEGAHLFAAADILETKIASKVDELVEALLGGDWKNFVPVAQAQPT
ncbi:hypothetical protein [Roseomonas haemaphysalidis]|uniref:Type I restriction modification DNA specificity domain-containing protein n=1 Tax=Roseomonas haemaphysalidis TaxID=2768162 RepID=A0ABS3KRG0_9PROT|nr:hypothetical protein [Roseomonas haemaphysalidis]MBO1080014.1 hypothetical protein [Roseomonas haemaphysalidis]